MNVDGNTLVYVGFLAGVAFIGREAYIHYMIVVLKRDLAWLKHHSDCNIKSPENK